MIMGFGKKQDPSTNRTIDLDETYKKIIRPAVESSSYRCIRADEILDSGIIDRSMYALLYHADLVIADISTYNPNAIYELGTRHALKRFSTIIIKENKGNIPFDFNHNRTLNYEHLGNEISDNEAKKCIRKLKELIIAISENPVTDSPLYSYIPKFKDPEISQEDIEEIVGELRSKETTIFSLMENAKELMTKNRFSEAAEKWRKLSDMAQNELYYIQQEALCTYKSESPSKLHALTNALQIINKIENSTDTETLGISGAINKRLWDITNEQSYLDTAIDFYKKGWTLYEDYYTGENYALCLEQKAILEEEEKYKIHKQVESESIWKRIIEIILPTLEEQEPEELKWKYATLANCYLSLNNSEKQIEFEEKFNLQNPVTWELKTYNDSKQKINNLRK